VTVSEASRTERSLEPAGLPEASLVDSLRVLVTGMLPALVRGLFSPRRGAMRWLSRVDADRHTVDALSAVRRKYGGQGVRLLGGRIVAAWGRDAIREVLDRSADVYASDAGAKAKGMCHFHPDALTISRGDEWRDRRAFNEHVLAADERLHPDAPRFLAVVADELRRLEPSELAWDRWEQLFDRITLRIVFGDEARDERELTALLGTLMGEANRLVGLKPNDAYYDFYARLERHLRDPQPGTLLARVADAPQTDRTRVAHQIPHWLFATRDTLGANTFRALAAIAADTALARSVRRELEPADLRDPSAVDSLAVLDGCLHEVMRLWPTVPLLAREVTKDTRLAGEQLEQGTQVMILNVFNHRDTERVPDADRIDPGRERDYLFNHLSNGAQDCPGAPLVSLLGKAVVGGVLDAHEVTLREPSLPSGGELPHMLNFYEIRFDLTPRATPAPADS
jgi:cytochrome P450